MKTTPLFALILALPLLTSAQPQSWGIYMEGPWRPSGKASFITREGDQDDRMYVTLTWLSLFPASRKDEVFNLYNSYEFNLSLHDEGEKLYKGCKSMGTIPEFYDDCDTAGISEFSGKVFGFGTYSTKQIVREKPYDFLILMEKYPSKLHDVKKGQTIPMSIYSEALNCRLNHPWSCGLNTQDRISHVHAEPKNLKNFSVYGVGGHYKWEGPHFIDVW